MLKIKDYIFNENEINYIKEKNEQMIINIYLKNDDIPFVIDATFEDIEWNYEQNNIEENKNLQQRIDKAIEYIGNGNLGIPRKTMEKFIKILKGE